MTRGKSLLHCLLYMLLYWTPLSRLCVVNLQHVTDTEQTLKIKNKQLPYNAGIINQTPRVQNMNYRPP